MKIRGHNKEERKAYKSFVYRWFKKLERGAQRLEDEGMHMGCPLCKGRGKVPKPDTKDDIKATDE